MSSTASVGINKLPSELLDECFHYLRRELRPNDETPTTTRDLASCTLVCHAWRPLAQACLFYRLLFAFDTADNSSEAAGVGYGDLYVRESPATLQSLRAFLTACPHIASAVRVACLGLEPPEDVDYDLGTVAPCHLVDHSLFLSLLALLPGVQELYLCDIVLKNVTISHMLRSLRKLTLHFEEHSQCLPAEAIIHLLSPFAHIGKLVLQNGSQHDLHIYPLPETYRSLSTVELQDLKLPPLHSSSPSALANMLSNNIHLDGVQRLDLPYTSPTMFQTIVNALSPGLQELCWMMESYPSYAAASALGTRPGVLDVRACTRLRTARVTVIADVANGVAAWRWYADGLCDFVQDSLYSLAGLQDIVIAIAIGPLMCFEDAASSLDGALMSLVQRSALQHITFESFAPRWWIGMATGRKSLRGEEFADFIHQVFPLLQKNNMVKIQAPPEEDSNHF